MLIYPKFSQFIFNITHFHCKYIIYIIIFKTDLLHNFFYLLIIAPC